MSFADIHIHALYGIDDGAQDASHMQKMIDLAYQDGTRYLCLTPHFHPGYYGKNREKADRAFSELLDYVTTQYSDLHLAQGNELYYAQGGEEWLQDGSCRTLNKTNYVLVDFPLDGEKKTISEAINRLLNLGYRPILAHVERYKRLFADTSYIAECKKRGALIQIDAMSMLGDFGFKAKRFCAMLLSRQLVDFVASDAHDIEKRPPQMSHAYEYIAKKYGKAYADQVCLENAKSMIFG